MDPTADLFTFADRFIDALNGNDVGKLREFYHPDATVWHNFDDHDQPLEENLKVFEWMVRKSSERRYRVLRREVVPGGWFQQHVLEAKSLTGREMRLYACCVVTLANGRIRRIEEYVDPAQAAVLREQRMADGG